MSNKQSSTIAAKPAIDPALQWIGGAATDTPAATTSQQNDKPAKKQADKLASKQEDEPTAMLSVRVPASLIKKLRIRAATEDRQIQEIATEILRDYLEKN